MIKGDEGSPVLADASHVLKRLGKVDRVCHLFPNATSGRIADSASPPELAGRHDSCRDDVQHSATRIHLLNLCIFNPPSNERS